MNTQEATEQVKYLHGRLAEWVARAPGGVVVKLDKEDIEALRVLLATVEGQGTPETLQHIHINDKQAVITGIPAKLPDSVSEDDQRRHNCDAMGCPTLDHVLYRLPFTDHREMSLHIRNQDEAGGASHE